MGTPHNQAEKGEIAKKVLMPGDPLRAKFIAEKFLTDAKLVNEVRGAYAYTGTYKGENINCADKALYYGKRNGNAIYRNLFL